jgi:alpha-L-arabinofuranosidase
MKRYSFLLFAPCTYAILSLASPFAGAQIDNTTPEWKTQQNRGQMEDAANQAAVKQVKIPREVKVSVDVEKPRGVMAPWVMAVHGLASDAHLAEPAVIQLLRNAGITTVRYPGGRIADTYHWSTNRPSNWQGLDHPNVGYAAGNHLGSFLKFMEQVGTTIFTVNYGSNLLGAGPGEPAEAAAWVAYMNGSPSDTKMIPSSGGNDWQTVGYWAGLRAAEPLATDDGKNFLRIQHPAPFGIRYWEIGNEVFENGYFGGEGLEEDLHTPYPKDAKENARQRRKNAALSPESYGKNFLQYAQAMKSVDPRIKVGISLEKPLAGEISRNEYSTQDPVTGKYIQAPSVSVKEDFNKGIDWDKGALSAACSEVDFVALHWYASDTTQDSGYKELDTFKLLSAPQDSLRQILMGLVDQLQKGCGQKARSIQVAFTEVGVAPWVKIRDEDQVATGLFAADLYPSLVEYGVVNADWGELHNGLLDENNKPKPPYFGMQMVHGLMNFNDALLAATSSSSLLSVHASKRADGSIGVMLINKDGKNGTTVKLQINGAAHAPKGVRFDYGKSNPPDGMSVQGKAIEGLSNSMTIPMPPFTATVIVMPKAQ